MSMDMDQSTTQLSGEHDGSGNEAAPIGVPAIPALTILYHPRLRRMGERVLLKELLVSGQDVEISRAAPGFAPPRSPRAHRGTPLAEKRISRDPFRLCRAGDGGIDVVRGLSRTRISIDGAELGEQRRVSPEELRRGILLELSGCILLLLHEHTPPEEPETGDLGLVGESSAMVRVRADIRRVADLDVTVLIRGQTGTGKELVAKAIHEHSPRYKRDNREMVSINISAIPATLAAAELFGAKSGAYSGGTQQEGYFRRAEGSTLFLDEIGEAPLDVQNMLLRVLETKEIQRLGTQRSDSVDVRVLAATDAPLERRVEQGRFSDPLFYRLAGYEIEIPPLRERREDIGQLMLHFLGLTLTEIGEPDRLDQIEPAPWLPMSVMAQLVRHDWPGNVRELRQAVHQLVIGNRGRAVAEMPPKLASRLDARRQATDKAVTATTATSVSTGDTAPIAPPRRRPSDIPDEEIYDVLQEHDWEVKAAADALGIARNTLYDRMRASESIRQAKDISDEELQAAYDACNGDLDAMAKYLRVSKVALKMRIKQSESKRDAKDIDAEELQEAYDACDGDLDAMARRLRVSRAALKMRMKKLGFD
jgi:two-component system nitrogen regulation response regulator GlnG